LLLVVVAAVEVAERAVVVPVVTPKQRTIR
jgi:hypothetical protein